MVNLKKVRREHGMTQEQLANLIGVVRTTISNIECGLTLPSVQTAKLIGKALNIDWVEFFSE